MKDKIQIMKRLLLTTLLLVIAFTATAQQVSVMSFNLRYNNPGDGDNRWDLRREAVVECIKDHNPDIIGTQEGLMEQIEYLEGELQGYERVGIAREDGKKQGEHSAVFFKSDRFELVTSDNSWLSETPDRPSFGWDAACIRITTTAVLRDKKNGKIVHAINTHFDHEGKEARRQSPKFILNRVAKAGDDAVIFTGDLNSTHGSEPIDILLNDGSLEDSFLTVKKHKGPGYSYHEFTGAPVGHVDGMIDYVMYNKGFKAKKNVTVDSRYQGRLVSDHYPVFAILKYSK